MRSSGVIGIERVVELDATALAPLVAASRREGWRHLQRLCEEWQEGANRFTGPGEGLYFARSDGRIVGVCGSTADPFARKAEIGRLRRLYVDPALRRRGVGSALVGEVLALAARNFRELRLRTEDAAAGRFFESLGFAPVTHLEGASHRIVLER